MAMVNNIKLKIALQDLGCSALAFSSLAAPPLVTKKVSQQTVSQWVGGTKELDETEAVEFLQVAEIMKHLQQTVTPRIPIAWSDVLGVKDVLVETYEKRKNELDPITRRCWFVRLSINDYFKGMRSDGMEIRTLNYFDEDAAAFTSYELAAKVVKRLNQHGIAAKAEVLTCERRRSTITTSLEEIGFTK
jgi:hypothetical protein